MLPLLNKLLKRTAYGGNIPTAFQVQDSVGSILSNNTLGQEKSQSLTSKSSPGFLNKVGGLQPYTTYYYTVKAYNVDGLKTLPSKEIQVQTIDPGSVNGSEAVAASVSRHGSTLFITSGHLAPFGIYSVSGACVASGMVAPDSSCSVELAPGAYVVTVGGRRFKVVM